MKITRKTTESEITVALDFSGVRSDYRSRINTPLPFLSHMLEQLVWRSGIGVSVDIRLDKFDLAHVVCEDAGITLGRAVAERLRRSGGVGFGDAFGVIDEARAQALISFESRAFYALEAAMEIPDETEGMYSEDLSVFLEGFAQGAACTLQLDIIKGQNAHHIWEAAFRAVGCALGRALTVDPARKGMTAGVAGDIQFIIEDGE